MKISGSVIAHKFLDDGTEIDDNVSCTLPSIEFGTTEIKGAGILGAIDMPSTAQLNSMTFAAALRATNKNSLNLAKPGKHSLELRFVKDTTSGDGDMIPEGTKIFVTGALKKFEPGKVEMGATMESNAEFEVIRYRIVIEGKEVLLIDKQNYIYKIAGKDYLKNIKATLG